ncbi:MAG: NADPH:quinone reductase-like Zn-dependent oxidoreductase [Patiriisocius sp.]|jgi:NADPH:quinone reductase-like Zn-dependent oxidoreductase
MRAWQLGDFGLHNLQQVEIARPTLGPYDVMVQLRAASINPRDCQIISGHFTPNVDFPLVPLSDGAGTVVELGEQVSHLRVGDIVTPLFFPNWVSGEAINDERKLSSGLEVPGVLREFGAYDEQTLVKVANHLSAVEAACLPCSGLTAWTSLVPIANIQPGKTVLIQGTGGVAIAALQFAKALGAQVIILSSSDEKLAAAKQLGADHCINYFSNPNWGPMAFELSGHGVDLVLEIGGTGTMENSLAAIRHGGHVAIIGYVAGVDMGITVFPVIIKCAHLHGIATGNRDNYLAMMQFMQKHNIKPQLQADYGFSDAARALEAIEKIAPFGKVVIDFDR